MSQIFQPRSFSSNQPCQVKWISVHHMDDIHNNICTYIVRCIWNQYINPTQIQSWLSAKYCSCLWSERKWHEAYSKRQWTNILPVKKSVETYMSITSLISTLTATSINGFPLLLLNLDETVMELTFDEDVSEQTAAITSHTSAGFNRRGCCSLIHIKTFE